MSQKEYVLSKKSLDRLQGVHPNLVKVVERAIQITDQDFLVVEGVRSAQQCYINWGKGRTADQCKRAGVPVQYAQPTFAKITSLKNPLNSKHCLQNSGFGHAVDLAPYPLDWNDLSKFRVIATAVKQAAKELEVTLAWGGDWTSFKDFPHFELKV